MVADPRLKENVGKVAVMRGPVVYCLEDEDVSKGTNIDSLCMTGDAGLESVYTDELGGLTKLTGSLVLNTEGRTVTGTSGDFNPEKGLYQETSLPGGGQTAESENSVPVSLIPYYARMNRERNCFKIWLPMYDGQ